MGQGTKRKKRIISIGFSFHFQGRIELLGDVFDHIGPDGADDDVQHGAEVRRDGDDGVRMADSWGDDARCGAVVGGDLLGVSDIRRTLLLERQALRQTMGSFRFLAHGMVRFRFYFPFLGFVSSFVVFFRRWCTMLYYGLLTEHYLPRLLIQLVTIGPRLLS